VGEILGPAQALERGLGVAQRGVPEGLIQPDDRATWAQDDGAFRELPARGLPVSQRAEGQDSMLEFLIALAMQEDAQLVGYSGKELWIPKALVLCQGFKPGLTGGT
jgi:hypothetical protein